MSRSIEYDLSRGFDKEAAEYFASGRRRIISVTPNEDFTLTLIFDGGERRILDCKPMLQKGTVFEPLMEYDNFKRVFLDERRCVAWDIGPAGNGGGALNSRVDLCSDGCYLQSLPAANAAIK